MGLVDKLNEYKSEVEIAVYTATAQTFDTIATIHGTSGGNISREGNPLGRHILEQYGPGGLITFEASSLLFCLGWYAFDSYHRHQQLQSEQNLSGGFFSHALFLINSGKIITSLIWYNQY